MEETLIKRSMPNSLDAEQSVIGSMIMDKDAILTAMEMLTSDDFYHKQYGILFDAMIELYSKGLPVDLITLQNKLKEKEVPEEISSLSYVKELLDAVPTSANIKYYAKIVKDNSMRRRLIRLNEEIENECYAGKESIDTVMDMTEKKVFDLLSTRGGGGDYVPIRQVVMNALEKIENAAKTSGTVTGIPTGFIDLDYRTAGLQPSDLILIAARPSMGKTAFVLNIAQYVAFHEDMCTAIFSLEMSKEQLVNRLFSLESRVDAQALRTGNLSDSDWEKLIEGAGTIGNSKLIIDDTPGISIAEMRSKCRKYKLEHDLKLIIIDYLQLMSGSGRGGDSRQQEISDISRALKGVARELNVPVISSMGTGNKLHPEMLEITDVFKTSVCPLAKVMRKELKDRGIKKLKVCYSKEIPLKPLVSEEVTNKRSTPGSISFVPSTAGLLIPGEIIRDICSL